MRRHFSWRDKAIDRIADCLLEYEVQCACLGEEITSRQARKYCNDRYPFGERKYTPYLTWLKELRLAIVFIESKRPAIQYLTWRSQVDSKGQHKGAKVVVSEGQMSLFD